MKIKTYPDNTANPETFIEIKNHWNDRDKVILTVNNQYYVVLAKELRAAITSEQGKYK